MQMNNIIPGELPLNNIMNVSPVKGSKLSFEHDQYSVEASELSNIDALSSADVNYNNVSGCTTSEEDWQESFQTYKPKVIQLCHDLGFGEPSKMESWKEGRLDTVISLSFPSTQQHDYDLRVSKYSIDEEESVNIGDQVAVLTALSRFEFLHVPSLIAFDLSQENAIGSQYILQQRPSGQLIEDVFYGLPLFEKLQITALVAKLLTDLESITSDKPGRLAATRSELRASEIPRPFATSDSINRIRTSSIEDAPQPEEQNLSSFLHELILNHQQSGLHSPLVLAMYDRLQVIVEEMEVAGFIRETDVGTVLVHSDLSRKKIVVNRTDKLDISGENSPQAKNNTPDEGLRECNLHTGEAPEEDCNTGCQHTIQITFDGTSDNESKHKVQIEVKDGSGKSCNHRIQVAVEHDSDKTYQSIVQITDTKSSGSQSTHQATTAIGARDDDEKVKLESPVQGSPARGTPDLTWQEWILSGVLDWDDVHSVPLVLARTPPSWLWWNEKEKSQQKKWSGERDNWRMTQDERLIKAEFDQMMIVASVSYIDDAYHRGPWVRELATFALHGFKSMADFDRYEKFVEEWDVLFERVRPAGTRIELVNSQRTIAKSMT